jgi:integrase
MAEITFVPYRKGPTNKWLARVRLHGKRRTKAVPTKRDGRLWAEDLERQLDMEAERNRNPEDLWYSSAVDEYCRDCRARMQPGTVSGKFRYANNFAAWLKRDIRLSEITTKQAREFHRHIAERSSNKNANEHLKHLKAMWNWHIENESLPLGANPWVRVEPMPEEDAVKLVPTREQVLKILMAADRDERDYLTFLIQSAARPGEIMRLTWDNVVMDKRIMYVWTRKRKGGNKQFRPLPITPTIQQILDRKWNRGNPEGPFVFTNPDTGSGYWRNSAFIKNMMKRICERAGIPRYTLSAFRHYVAQRLEDGRKADLVDIQRLLGHQRATTTDNYLRELAPDVSKVGGILEEDFLQTVEKVDTRVDTQNKKRVYERPVSNS